MKKDTRKKSKSLLMTCEVAEVEEEVAMTKSDNVHVSKANRKILLQNIRFRHVIVT